MDEIKEILAKYDQDYLRQLFACSEEADQLVLVYFEDVAEILSVITRMTNIERNPTGFSIADAPILGLLVRISKLLKLVIWIYREDSAEYVIIAERSLIEVAVTATYLLRSDSSTLEDYRLCSYKDRLKILEQAESGLAFYDSKAGHRLTKSIKEKLDFEGLDRSSFKEQIANHWRLGGRNFREIFEQVMGPDLYPYLYSTSSDSVHGSWHDVRGFCLKDDVTRGFFPLYEPVDTSAGSIRMITQFVTLPFREWTERVQLDDPYIVEVLDFIEKIGNGLFIKYDKLIYGD